MSFLQDLLNKIRAKTGPYVSPGSVVVKKKPGTVLQAPLTKAGEAKIKQIAAQEAVNPSIKKQGLLESIFTPPDLERTKIEYSQAGTPLGKAGVVAMAGLGLIPGTPEAKGVVKATAKVAEKAVERGFITSVKEAVPVLAKKIAGQYIPRDTDELAMKAKNQIKDNIQIAEHAALTGTDDKAVAMASELIKHYGDLGQKAGNSAESIAFYDKAAEIANKIAPKLTEMGRSIQAASILGRMTPEGMTRFAARTIQKYNEEITDIAKKVPELTGEQTEQIITSMKKVTDLPDGPDKAIAFKAIMDDMADLVPAPGYKKIISLWKAGLLTGLKTSGLNTLSNLSHGISEVVKDIPAVVVDKVSSLFTGERTLGLTGKDSVKGLKEGFEKGVRYFKTGYDERDIAGKLDLKNVSFGKSKFAQGLKKYEQTVFRALGAEDQPFYYGAKARSLQSQAIAMAKNKGLKGDVATKFMKEVVENPTDKMLQYATNDAEMAVFQNKTMLGDVAKKIQDIPGGEVVVPFGRTPAAVAMQLVNYSPIGIVKTIVENIGKGKFDQRLFSQAVGRGLTGTAAMFIGGKLFDQGLISLGRPESERERNQWELEGRKENSIKINGKWRGLNTLGPIGNVLIVGGYVQRGIKETGSLMAGLAEGAAGGLKSLKEQTFLRGLDQFVNAVMDPARYAPGYAKSTIASIVPTIVSDVAQATDTKQRRTETIGQGLKARIPILRNTLEPKVDVLGTPLEAAGNALEILIDPTRPSRIKSSTVVNEFRRLADAGELPTPTSFGDEKKKFASLTPEQRTQIMERAGTVLEEKLTNLFQTDEYKAMSDEDKRKEIQNFADKSRVLARIEMTDELVGQLDGEALQNKLTELKESGFLTKEVFEKWKELFY